MKKIANFIRSRTYMEIIATLHLLVMAVVAWSLLQIAQEGYFKVDVIGTVGIEGRIDVDGVDVDRVDVDTSGIEYELSKISGAIDVK